ncbi:MAG: hypothetical protein IPM69_04820 [Ignavibacteria bacterium]|nr:hypothetical protein [Ignavibacteria bacterium]
MKLLFLTVFAILFSCSSHDAKQPTTKISDTSTPPPFMLGHGDKVTKLTEIPSDTIIPAVARKYGIKSGILTMDLEIIGANSSMKTIVYFDDYGNRESSETFSLTKLENGQSFKAHVMAYNIDGYQYQVDFDNKTAMRFTYNPQAMSGGFSYATMTDKMKKDYKVTKVGTEVILGKVCDNYTMDSPDVKGRFSVWKNITFKLHTVSGGFTTNVIAKKFEENVPIPQDKFEVPSGFRLKTN